MYALVIVRYRYPVEEITEALRHDHREYLRMLKGEGILLASGPFQPHHGGAFLLRIPADDAAAALNKVRDGDPFFKSEVAQYELLIWDVKTGLEDLEGISWNGRHLIEF